MLKSLVKFLVAKFIPQNLPHFNAGGGPHFLDRIARFQRARTTLFRQAHYKPVAGDSLRIKMMRAIDGGEAFAA